MGLPTMLLRPITTASLPFRSTPVDWIIYRAPLGVQATTPGVPVSIWPALIRWKPSTSFSGRIFARAAFSSRCFGSGSCTRIPWIAESLFSSSIAASSCSWVVSSGMLMVREYIPTSAQPLPLFRT